MPPRNHRPIRVRSETERRRAFFYAEADADAYDAAADLNTPLFALMHQTMLELVRQHRRSLSKREQKKSFVILDIGSGTGAESISILKEFPHSHVVAFDLCEPMHTLFRKNVEKVLGKEAVDARCHFLTGDIASAAGTKVALLRPLQRWGRSEGYDVITSALTLHHLTTIEKRKVYLRIASILKPGGVFINGDLFTFLSPTMARLATEFGLNWIRKQFTDPDPRLRRMRDAIGTRAAPMMNSWLDHYIKYNLPDPIESSADSLSNSRQNQRSQARMLVEAGFSEVACPFRYWEVGILWANK